MFGVELSDPILLSMEGQAFELLLWTAQIEQRRSSWPVELLREDALEGFEKERCGSEKDVYLGSSPSLHGSVFTVAQCVKDYSYLQGNGLSMIIYGLFFYISNHLYDFDYPSIQYEFCKSNDMHR